MYSRSYLEALSERPSHLLPQAVGSIFSQVCPSVCLLKVLRTAGGLSFEHSHRHVGINLVGMLCARQLYRGEILGKGEKLWTVQTRRRERMEMI